jgi:hypothetical protein
VSLPAFTGRFGVVHRVGHGLRSGCQTKVRAAGCDASGRAWAGLLTVKHEFRRDARRHNGCCVRRRRGF